MQKEGLSAAPVPLRLRDDDLCESHLVLSSTGTFPSMSGQVECTWMWEGVRRLSREVIQSNIFDDVIKLKII